MTEWIKIQKHIPASIPPEGVMVECKGSDYMGEFEFEAIRKTYKNPPSKGKPRGWRFVDAEGKRTEQADYWRPKITTASYGSAKEGV